ncbi:hypothetical protein [Sphingomonas glacialis]|jgi:hypothetical protein|uniref:Uncharacterized protein n=1 Tax=Sphingomonas glacialis TaxID=658225 RepID=A0A502G0J8_9SPHN|nr:hypothetical protein [Sphingomonas glacialis]TPG55060.1 hypothetical protein EAH76_10840 [Sphingomonas glacialis]
MAAPSMVFTARFAASRLGVDIDVIEQLAEQMAPEDGCLSIINSLDETAESVTGFTRQGLDYLDELLDERRLQFVGDL